jgi:TonB family protein
MVNNRLFKYILSAAFFTLALNGHAQTTEIVKSTTIKFRRKAIDKAPEFPGGQKAFYEYLSDNITYPQNTKDKDLQGVVVVTMSIEQDGHVSDVKIVRGKSELLNKETVRVLSHSPDWKPGIQRGRPIRVRPTITINYSMVNTKG